jgi:lysophospholipase L1-like esterase
LSPIREGVAAVVLRLLCLLLFGSLVFGALTLRAQPPPASRLAAAIASAHLAAAAAGLALLLLSLAPRATALAAQLAAARQRPDRLWPRRLAAAALWGYAAAVVLALPLAFPQLGIAGQLRLLAPPVLAALLLAFAGADAPEARRSLRELGAGLLLALVSTSLVEAAARLATFRHDNVLGRRNEIYHFVEEPVDKPGPYGDLAPQESVWTLLDARPYTVKVNSAGLRNDEEVDWSARRILCLGDSYTFGPFVANADTWPAQLEDELGRRGITGVQVLNAGHSGYTILQELSYLEDKGRHLKPELVLLGFFANDVGDLARFQQGVYTRPEAKSDTLWRWLKRHSALMHVGRSWARESLLRRTRWGDDGAGAGGPVEIADPGGTPAALQEAALVEQYRRLFLELVHFTRRESLRLAVVRFPAFYELPSGCESSEGRMIAELCAAAGVPLVDLLPSFRGSEIESLYLLRYEASRPAAAGACFPEQLRYVGNKHLSRYGYQLAGRAVARFVAEARLLEPAQ